ncbi:FUSC family protein [Oryzomonas rubra]|uniref:FUSC family protein n=1 Tax=Oryzomonas rubra TaxID=2509454 RepID=A0A5A9X7Y5_9BACT|nr:FUSC family protein [Oryzomonas rubra]KAA0889080.1 FUSC family protein [Oryzomonas rubra]
MIDKETITTLFHRFGVFTVLQNAVVCLVAYPCGEYSTGIFHGESASMGGLWSLISGLVVLQATTRDTWTSAGLRVLGTFIGAFVSGLYLSFLPFSPVGMAVSIGVTIALCQILKVPEHSRLAAITVAVIMVISHMNPTLNPAMNAVLRFGEACIGSVAALAIVFVTPRSETRS